MTKSIQDGLAEIIMHTDFLIGSAIAMAALCMREYAVYSQNPSLFGPANSIITFGLIWLLATARYWIRPLWKAIRRSLPPG